ncbi:MULTISPECIES: methylmalonyl-CoA epimerase [Thermoanaerobacterium]|uniref:Methylmalonyl-CoA epimerase n=2 Tax=Thermoanaerobacterium TaxID=28895 RepID=W9E8F8_9THEO|nr:MULTISPECIES: methylmalonyl-CoA epimerase [Thermoanaerobacterium]AFK87170.1 methylmalonyl-CoA epimerase [Thermoanaerobacterium saccharolyticum JW/SL-YS485]ETO38133.1 methylmalonyl-CoA epimerase [Thermoanaerobacterium aotearoense SCUT27]
MVKKIDHIGIAVKSIEEASKFYEDVLGQKVAGIETLSSENLKTAFVKIGDVEIELLEATSPDSPVAKFIEKKGEGIHHIAFKVDDIEASLEKLKSKGIRLIDEIPKLGAEGSKIAFAHPKSTNGVLLELCQK